MIRCLSLLLLLFAFLLSSCSREKAEKNSSPKIKISLQQSAQHRTSLKITGIDFSSLTKKEREKEEESINWNTIAPVYVQSDAENPSANSPPIAGEYTISNNALHFTPAYPFEHGITYSAHFKGDQLSEKKYHALNKVTTLTLPEKTPSYAPTRVTAIYPHSDELPENLLRFYIYFSAPMREGDFLRHIQLYNEESTDLSGVFFDNQHELWNHDHTRLTIILDPGRVKSGLLMHEKIGRALQAGKKYTLRIQKTWQDIRGNPLHADFEKTFTVLLEDRQSPDPTRWHITPPKAQTKDTLRITFDQALDHLLITRYLSITTITDQKNKPLQGKFTADSKNPERAVFFMPKEAWRPGTYHLHINPRLEDLAGNNLLAPFDHKSGSLKNPKETPILHTLTFKISSKTPTP